MESRHPNPPSVPSAHSFSWSPLVWLRRLYDWVTSFADKPSGTWVLFAVAVAEASFFPIPPDVLLIALAVASPRRSYWFATVCTVGSLLGAVFGYLIGYQFYDLLGRPIVEFYSAGDTYLRVQRLYEEWNAVAVGVAGFTPIPYKVFTIAAGAFKINFPIFMAASAVSRAGRFFLVGGLIHWFGPRIRETIEKYFNLLAVLFAVLVVTGFLVLKYVF